MSHPWTLYAIGTNQCVQAQAGGRYCYQMTTSRDQPNGLNGDGNNGQFRKRAQFRQVWFHPLHAEYKIRFSSLIPGDWQYSRVPRGIFDLHQYSAEGKTPWQIQVKGNMLVFKSAWGVYQEFMVVPDQWDDWEFQYLPSVEPIGWVKLYRNGDLVVDVCDIQTTYEDTEGNYTKIGPYMWQVPNPDSRTFTRLYMQLDFNQ